MKERTILHVDMDAFYASVEVLRNPSLRGKPVIVGGDGPRGVVASCSYEARAFGIRSAMPSVRAKRLCPHAVFVHGNHGLYAEYSARIHRVFETFTPLIEGIALDEAFLDVSGGRRRFATVGDVGLAVRAAVFDETGLLCCVGIARNKLLAKLASKEAKPAIPGAAPRRRAGIESVAEGVVVVPTASELAFLHGLPVRALWGVGPKTFERLQRFGVQTVGDLAAVPHETLTRALGSAVGSHLHLLANGTDDRAVEPDRPLKSIGHEETFGVDHFELAPLELELLRMSDAVASRARRANVCGRTVHLKVKTSDFALITRAKTLPVATASQRVLHDTVVALLRTDDVCDLVARLGVRLIGVSMSNLVDSNDAVATGDTHGDQLDLFSSGGSSVETAADPVVVDQRVTAAIDAIRERFGTDAVGSASLSGGAKLRVKREGDTQWGPNAPT